MADFTVSCCCLSTWHHAGILREFVIFREIVKSRMADKCLQAAMAALRRKPRGADFRVVVEEEVIMAHHFLLVAR